MFYLKQHNLFWDGKDWIDDWRMAMCYGSAVAAIKAAPNQTCFATGFTVEQWDAFYNKQKSPTQQVSFEIAIAGHGNLIPFDVAILSGEYLSVAGDPVTTIAIRRRIENALHHWKQTPEGRAFWHLHGDLPCVENLSADLDPELLAYIEEAGILKFQIRQYRIEQDWDYYSPI